MPRNTMFYGASNPTRKNMDHGPATGIDTNPIQSRIVASRTRSVMLPIRGRYQTRKASINRLSAGGSPSFAPPRGHHRVPAPPPATAATRLDVSHGIIACVRGEMGNALCRAGKRSEKAKWNRTISISTVAYATGVISVITRKLYDICSRMCLYVTELQLF